MANDRHTECQGCKRVFPAEEVVFVPNGETGWGRRAKWADVGGGALTKRVVSREGEGMAREWSVVGRGSKIFDGWAKRPIVGGERLCCGCRGVDRPTPPPPVWRVARDAWADAVRENPALAKFAPRR